MINTVLAFVATVLGGHLYEFEDGYIIAVLTGKQTYDISFSVKGEFEKIEVL